MLLGMYAGAIYGGSITAILVGTPGTVAAAATLLEGPKLTARTIAQGAGNGHVRLVFGASSARSLW